MSIQMTYYVLMDELAELDRLVLPEFDAVIVYTEGVQIKTAQVREPMTPDDGRTDFGITMRKWLPHIENRVYDTPRGTMRRIRFGASPAIEADVFRPRPGIIKKRRFYAWTETDFAYTHVEFDMAEWCAFARAMLKRWKRELTYVKDIDWSPGYYSERALDAVRRGTMKTSEQR